MKLRSLDSGVDTQNECVGDLNTWPFLTQVVDFLCSTMLSDDSTEKWPPDAARERAEPLRVQYVVRRVMNSHLKREATCLLSHSRSSRSTKWRPVVAGMSKRVSF